MSTLVDHPLFTSRSEEYGTPQDLFDWLDSIFDFTLDPCAAPWNAKCDKFYTIEDDGLNQSWANETVFMNPPYGTNIGDWMSKAYKEALLNNATVVVLVHSRTDTIWWHNWAMRASKIWLVDGRLKFYDPEGETSYNAPFPSCVLIYEPGNLAPQSIPTRSIRREGGFNEHGSSR